MYHHELPMEAPISSFHAFNTLGKTHLVGHQLVNSEHTQATPYG
jgi:hypothetical protein